MIAMFELAADTVKRGWAVIGTVSFPLAVASSRTVREILQASVETALSWATIFSGMIALYWMLRKFGVQGLKFWQWFETYSPRMNRIEALIQSEIESEREVRRAHADQMLHVMLFDANLDGEWTWVSEGLIAAFLSPTEPREDTKLLGYNWLNYIDETEVEAVNEAWQEFCSRVKKYKQRGAMFEKSFNLLRGVKVHISTHSVPGRMDPKFFTGHFTIKTATSNRASNDPL